MIGEKDVRPILTDIIDELGLVKTLELMEEICRTKALSGDRDMWLGVRMEISATVQHIKMAGG